MENLGGQPVDVSNTVVGSTTTASIPNPGILGGVPYNEWFVAFGQFFDHGLDFITKGGGYVLIPLSPSDPLYNPDATGPTANTMMLSRAKLSNPASDYHQDTNGNYILNDDAVPAFNNSTGLLIDQSQTYGSHASINVLLRQYTADGDFTGKLITSAEDMTPPGTGATPEEIAAYNKATHDLGTWADMKVNAARIGIGLADFAVLDAPLIRANSLGEITFTAQHEVVYGSDMSIQQMLDAGMGYNPDNDPYVRWTQPDADNNLCLDSQVGFARTCNQAILSDIANGASPMNPMGSLIPANSDPNADLSGIPGIDFYDPTALDKHYVSGDHRANENVGLTAVHHVFHEEHNIEVDAIKLAAVQDAVNNGNFAALDMGQDGWLGAAMTSGEFSTLVSNNTSGGVINYQAIADALSWDTEKVYQASRIITESEYNHVAIDQYVGGLVVLPEFVSYSSDVNLDISLEFSQAVFRLGHSQLSETLQIAVPDPAGNAPSSQDWTPTYIQKGLFEAFLNPSLYGAEGAAAITMGLLNEQGNEIDEFVTASLQQSLVGVPLDLPALNIARGRDVGLPTLNELRQQIFDGLVQNTNNASNPGIAPYTSWEDFGGHLRTPESLVNFIAAYGREDTVFGLDTMRRAYEAGTLSGSDSKGSFDSTALDPTPNDGAITLQDLRANAQIILDAAAINPGAPVPTFETQAEQDYYNLLVAKHDDAVMFMRGQGSPTYDPVTHTWDQNNTGGGDQGFWDIDLWVGGLAEQPLFDGPLGTTFTFVMEDFGQRMQDGDRFYYLYRMPVGHHLGDQIIGEQFADLVMRTTGLEHIGDAFGYQSATYILDGTTHDNGYDGTFTGLDANGLATGGTDQYGINDYFNSIYENLPDSVKAFVVANNSFEVDSLTSGDPGVMTDASLGNYTMTAPTGWTLAGNGGLFAPTTGAIANNGHQGGNVAWLVGGAVLTAESRPADRGRRHLYLLGQLRQSERPERRVRRDHRTDRRRGNRRRDADRHRGGSPERHVETDLVRRRRRCHHVGRSADSDPQHRRRAGAGGQCPCEHVRARRQRQ